ncbi:MAG TPA: cyclic nucleotide-binding domain-containing protein [Longimicrobium sp.]|nr:cyclic nucleotide-binding domain-containing protein [Longimicrobium sp.]
MPSVPPYLNEIGDEDARWLQEHGVQMHVRAGDRVITEGVTPEHLYVVLDGEFRVSSQAMNDPDMLRAGAGELLGEMSYINGSPPGASVLAVVDSVLLAVPRADIDAKIDRDPAFGSRFRKMLMDFAVNRMWLYNRRDWNPPPPQPDPDPYADLRVHELIEKLLRGEF